MNKAQLKPDQVIIKRLLMRIDPLFFSYDKSKQDLERQSYYHLYGDMITESLFKQLFQIEYEKGEENEDKLTKEQLDLFNAYITSLTGIGENSFVYNEFKTKDFDLCIYPTLYDYDFEEFHYQQNARNEHSDGEIIERPYRLYLNSNWTRLLDEQGCFYYSTQSSLSNYLYQKLSDHASDRIDQLIPHNFVEGPNNGKETKGGFLWDFKIDAKGLEKQLEELEARYRKYLNELELQMIDTFHEELECAVYFDKSTQDDEEPRWDIIIKNAQTAKNISFQRYLKDCEKYLKPNEMLEDLYQQELEKLDAYINENYHDVMENFNPKVKRFKRKMDVIIAPKALEGLARIRDDEE
tara:strand:+ start:44371 stop:45426 length:1056 start_codon:yes stop_codon:yes gene_type:complete